MILAEAYARQSSFGQSVTALNSVRRVLKTGVINGAKISADYQALGIQYDDYLEIDFEAAGIASTRATKQQSLLYEIISQKYILLLAQYESFNEVRRLSKATPVVQLSIPLVVPTPTGILPQRFIYPQTEINTNPNVPKVNGAVADQYQKLTIFQ